MNSKTPSYFVAAATGIILVSIGAKKIPLFFNTLGRSDLFEWGCAISSSACVAIGLLLALHGLNTQASKRSYFLGVHFSAILVLLWVFGIQVSEYVVFTNVYRQLDQIPSVLPKLIENSRTLDTEEKRQKMAENAYKIYGVIIGYRKDTSELVYYQPTSQDIAFEEDFAHTTSTNQKLTEEIIGGQLKQLPFVLSAEAGVFFLTFMLGTVWLILRKPKLISSP